MSSVSSISSVSSLSLIESALLVSVSPVTKTTPRATKSDRDIADAATGASDDDGSSSATALSRDLLALLKALVMGDAAEAKTDLAKVQTDLKPASTDSAIYTPTPLDTLLAQLWSDLDSGSTSTALEDMAAYLVKTGAAIGNLVNLSV